MNAFEQITDHFFRHETGKLRAALTRVLGVRFLDLTEDIIQETLYRALTKWPIGGVPPDPSGWIFRTAKNIAIDQIRRQKLFDEKSPEIAFHLEQLSGTTSEEQEISVIEDDQLRMIFLCCDDNLSIETQIVLTLKLLCSFHNKEIAAGLLKKESAVEKIASRGKAKIREQADFMSGDYSDMDDRVDNVCRIIYLMFNEGFYASHGDEVIKESLILESVRLIRILAKHPDYRRPSVQALAALVLFHAARIPARSTEDGQLILIQDQDRSIWDEALIQEAQNFLNDSSVGEDLSEYHLLAGIAGAHAYASSYEKTDWVLILNYYTMLAEVSTSPLVSLNRIVVLLELDRHEEAKEELMKLKDEQKLDEYHLFYVVRAELEARNGKQNEAVKLLNEALNHVKNPRDKHQIISKIERIEK